MPGLLILSKMVVVAVNILFLIDLYAVGCLCLLTCTQ